MVSVVSGLGLNNTSGGSVTCVDNNSNALTVVATNGSTTSYLAYGIAQSGATSYTWNWTTSRKYSGVDGVVFGVRRHGDH